MTRGRVGVIVGGMQRNPRFLIMAKREDSDPVEAIWLSSKHRTREAPVREIYRQDTPQTYFIRECTEPNNDPFGKRGKGRKA